MNAERRPSAGGGAHEVGGTLGTIVPATTDTTPDADVIEFVVGLRRRREAARRLPPLPFAPFHRDPLDGGAA